MTMDGQQVDEREIGRVESRAWEIIEAANALINETVADDVRRAAEFARAFAGKASLSFKRQDWAIATLSLGDAESALQTAQGWQELYHEVWQLWPDVQSRREQKAKGRDAHARAYGTADDRARRDARLVREFDFCRAQGAGKEKAYRAVARANGCSDRIVREAVKHRT